MKIHSAIRGARPNRISSALRSAASRNALMFRDDPGNKGEDGAAAEKLKKKNDDLVAEEKKLRARLKELEEKQSERDREAEKAEAEKLESEKNWKALEAKMAERLQKAEDRATKAETGLKDYQINTALNSELEAVGVTNPTLKKAALAMLKTDGKFDISETGDISVSGAPIKDYFKNWSGDEGKSFIQNGNGGGNAPKQVTGNPGNQNGTVKPSLGGNVEERKAAIRERFPDLGKET